MKRRGDNTIFNIVRQFFLERRSLLKQGSLEPCFAYSRTKIMRRISLPLLWCEQSLRSSPLSKGYERDRV